MIPLVLVHGFMGGSAQWEHSTDQLERHLDIVAVDLPGYGKNAHLPPIDSIVGFAEWVIAHLKERGIRQYHLLGHSMGGMIVQEIARRDSDAVQKLILYATGSKGIMPGRFETIAESKRRADADGASATARRISATWFLALENAEGYEHCAQVAEHATIESIHAGLTAMESWDGSDALGQINQPTLVLWGDQDRAYLWPQIEALWQHIPNTNLAVVPNCSHAVHAENKFIFQQHLIDFLLD